MVHRAHYRHLLFLLLRLCLVLFTSSWIGVSNCDYMRKQDKRKGKRVRKRRSSGEKNIADLKEKKRVGGTNSATPTQAERTDPPHGHEGNTSGKGRYADDEDERSSLMTIADACLRHRCRS